MKTILLIRHAKSSWANLGQQDFDRPLNERGLANANTMAVRLLKEGVAIDWFVSSPAKRAISTCKIFTSKYKFNENNIIQLTELYHAVEEIYYDVIENLDNTKNVVAIFGHNPGISEIASSLPTNKTFVNMPTCGIVAVQANLANWKYFNKAKKELLFFKYPKDNL